MKTRILALLLVFLVAIANVSAHQAPSVIVVDSNPFECTHTLTLQANGFPPNTTVTVTINGTEQACGGTFQSTRSGFVGYMTTDTNGLGVLQTTTYGTGSYVFSFYTSQGMQLFTQGYLTPVTYPPGVFVPGMQVTAPFGAQIRMNPFPNSKLIWNLSSNTSMVVLETAVGNNNHLWVRTANIFQLENRIFTEQVGWIDTFNHPINYVTGTPINPRVCPQTFSTYQACSVLATINLKVRTNPNVTSTRVGFVYPNTNYTVTGRNLSGTWVQVVLTTGVTGWACSHLLRGNFNVSTLPVVDSTQFYCNSDNIP